MLNYTLWVAPGALHNLTALQKAKKEAAMRFLYRAEVCTRKVASARGHARFLQ
jgi:hypothetical protein